MAKKVKSTKDKLTQNKNKSKMKQETQKPPKAKPVGVEQLHPKVDNKDSLTDNIQSVSKKKVQENSGLGKIKRVPLSQKLSVDPSQKKK